MWKLFGGLYLGWGIGANDSANIFGTAVSTKVIKWITAATIIAVFAFIGSLLQGAETVVFVKNGLGTINTLTQGFIAAFSAALTIMMLTIMSIPSSTSQSAAGAMIGMTLTIKGAAVPWAGLIKAVKCWVLTPIGAAIFSIIFYILYKKLVEPKIKNVNTLNKFIKIATVLTGALAAYSLGANNCGNATGFFYFPKLASGKDFITHLSKYSYTLNLGNIFGNTTVLAGIGGAAISIGALSYSRKVMMTVGEGITRLDPVTSLIVVLAEGLTVWIFAFVGVPVSTSQAVVGAVLGIGLIKGMKTVKKSKLIKIFVGWAATPVSAGVICYVITKTFF